VICPGIAVDQLHQAVADVSKILSGIPARELVVSASVGMSPFEPGYDADTMIAKADASMYADKNQKRSHGVFRESHR
jgi:PleD family two-component response regulator